MFRPAYVDHKQEFCRQHLYGSTFCLLPLAYSWAVAYGYLEVGRVEVEEVVEVYCGVHSHVRVEVEVEGAEEVLASSFELMYLHLLLLKLY